MPAVWCCHHSPIVGSRSSSNAGNAARVGCTAKKSGSRHIREVMKMRAEENLANMQARMEETGIDLVAIGPTANMRYLLGFVPHADERLCLLLVDRQSVRMVVPGLNREEVAAHTGIDLIHWADADGPQEALRKTLEDFH